MAYHKHHYMLTSKKREPNRLENLLKRLSNGEKLMVEDFDFPSSDNIVAFPNQSDTPEANEQPVLQEFEEILETQDTPETVSASEESVIKSKTEIPDIEITPEEEEYGYYLRQDEELAEADDFLETASKFCLLVKKIDWKLRTCKDRMVEEERIVQDILHECQQPLKDEKDGLKLYRLLHRSRKKRQEFKDLFIVLKLLQDYIFQNRAVFDGLMPIVNTAEKKVNNRKSRFYMQRSDSLPLPVGDDYRSLPKEEQERVRAIYEQCKQNN